MMRDGIASTLRAQPDMELAGEAGDGHEAIEQFNRLRPDVVLLDLNMPEMNGLDALKVIRERFADARIVVLTTYNGDVLANRALKAGALGYLLKSSLRTDMVGAIRAAHQGKRYVPADVAVAIAKHLGTEDLSPREVEILRHIAAGLSNKEIANELGVSDETVKTHLKSVFSKLHVSDRSHAIATALERGIFQL
ncbi:DNA-binding response regulator [Steroidobacter agaridevorans]|uniref:DNA-binding response regulator n=2 Tax=Steroidobacter agaridevorans TaxID=2695856 RepID=A0A829YIA7_9GAMM|nr:DNA-binding response regulator [Steroidobacter agaridevorans]